MKSYMTRQTRKSEQNLSLNFELRDSEIELYSTIQDKNLKTPTQIAQDKELRKFRESQNKLHKTVSGIDMANFLEKYAEIGFEYVTKVKFMIKKNQLSKFENSSLGTF